MKTLKISKEEMLKRVSVFKDLKPLPIQLIKIFLKKVKILFMPENYFQ